MKRGGTKNCFWSKLANGVVRCAFVVAAVLYGGEKTNNVPPNMNPPLSQMMQGGGSFQTGFTGLTGLSGIGNLVNLVNPVQQTFAERKAANWNVRGAWKDSFWLDFEDGWLFPWGTNHLTGVEVVSYGELWAAPSDTNAVASAGEPFEIVRGLTTFGCAHTPSNSYRFAWTDAALGRDTNALVSAALELFRNGDVSVTTNGVTRTTSRALPFPHSGYGQDAEWVAANFTNAAEILAVGYANWVDAQVGVGLTNGLYKLTVTVAEDPPETTRLGVGGLSVAVTNAGEYVFLLEKGVDYPLAVFPATATNFAYSAVDDVPQTRGTPDGLRDGPHVGRWTSDAGRVEIVVPFYPLVLASPAAHICWRPQLDVSPLNWQPSLLAPDETFAAVLVDVPLRALATFHWSASDPEAVSIESPGSAVTRMTAHVADISQTALALEVQILDCTLHSFLRFDNGEDNPCLVVSAPDTLFVNDDDDNRDSTNDCVGVVSALDDDIVAGRILFHSPVPTNGTIVVEGIYGYDEGFVGRPLLFSDAACENPIEPGWSFAVLNLTDWSQYVYFNPGTASTEHPGVQVKARWRPAAGPDFAASAFLTIVSPVAEPVCNATTNVVEGGVAHDYTVNPSGVAVGRDAYFRVEVTPDDYPDEKIGWVATGPLRIMGDGVGRAVTVRGTAAGDATLAAYVGDCRSDAPTFTVKVVENVTVNLRAWIIENAPLQKRPIEPDNIRQMVKDANDIYAQVGVTLNLVEPIVITNIPNAYDALYYPTTNETSHWTFGRVVNIATNTCGLECYFINSFLDKDETVAANGFGGMVITKGADYLCLAHEIGHAFGMCDIYKSGGTEALTPGEMVCATNVPCDWNNGSVGCGHGGVRYYKPGTTMSAIIDRMLMNGRRGDGHIDITAGDVYGVWYTYDENDRKIWHKGKAPTAFLFPNSQPVHQ